MSATLDEVMDEIVQRQLDRFTVDDDQKAMWAMRKLRAVRQKVAENERIAAEEIERIKAWLAEANSAHERDLNYFTGLLTDYAARQRAEHDRKSIVLPHGKVSSRRGTTKIVVSDAEAFLAWAKANNHLDLIRVKEEPSLSAIKDAFPPQESPLDAELPEERMVITADGEIVAGLTAQPSSITYSVEVDL